MADVIAECVEKLAKDEKRGKQGLWPRICNLAQRLIASVAVSFHFSRVGNDEEAQILLEKLDDNKKFGKYVDCLPATEALELLEEDTERWTVVSYQLHFTAQ